MSKDTTTPDDKSTKEGESKDSLPEKKEDFSKSAESQRSDVPTQQPAEESKVETPEKSESVQTEDKELEDWAKKEGIDFDNPTPDDARRLAKRLRDTQGKLHEKASELKKQIGQPQESEDDDGKQDALMAEMRLLNFYADNPGAREYDSEMASIYTKYSDEESHSYDPVFAEHLRENIGVLFNLARAESVGKDTTAARQQGGKDALKNAERSQASSAPNTNATKPDAPSSSQINDEKVAEWTKDSKLYEEHREEILAYEKKKMGL